MSLATTYMKVKSAVTNCEVVAISYWQLKSCGHSEHRIPEVVDDEDDEDNGRGADWDGSDSERSNMPEELIGVSGKWEVPACAMDSTKDGSKDHQEK